VVDVVEVVVIALSLGVARGAALTEQAASPTPAIAPRPAMRARASKRRLRLSRPGIAVPEFSDGQRLECIRAGSVVARYRRRVSARAAGGRPAGGGRRAAQVKRMRWM
jgi:hypothetical protein